MRRRDFLWLFGCSVAASCACSVRAQQTPLMVGVLSPASSTTTQVPGPFLGRMKELGWEEGGSYQVLFQWAEGHVERFPALVDELVARHVNVIVALGEPALEAGRRATATST